MPKVESYIEQLVTAEHVGASFARVGAVKAACFRWKFKSFTSRREYNLSDKLEFGGEVVIIPSNINLTREIAVQLIKKQEVSCPNCKKDTLKSRYTHKNQNVEYKCPFCKTIYHPCKLI